MRKKIRIDDSVSSLFLGLNWGVTKEKGWFEGVIKRGVDLDLGAFVLKDGKIVDQLIYANPNCKGQGVSASLSMDDNTGDLYGNDKLDNETIAVNFDDTIDDSYSIVFFLMSYSEIQFGKIPYVECRFYDGFMNDASNVYMDVDYSKNKKFMDATSVLIAKLDVINSSKELVMYNEILDISEYKSLKAYIEKHIVTM